MELKSWPLALQTPRQLEVCLVELGDFSQALQRAEIRAKVNRTKTTPGLESLSLESKDLLHHFFPGRPTRLQVDQLVRSLTETKSQLPVVHLTLPTLPGTQVKSALVSWFRQLTPLALVDFQVDRGIAGGMVVRTTSLVFDYSLRTKLLEQPDGIAEALRRV